MRSTDLPDVLEYLGYYGTRCGAAFGEPATYGYDANRDYLTSASYGDGLPNASPTWSYDAAGKAARCDGGLRVSKVSSGTTTRYRYDGQMGMQDVEVTGANTVVTNYGLGARGVDFMERIGTSTVTGFPIYDAHGNNVATHSRSGSTYSIGDQRSYDALGGLRAQQNAGDPKLRYCANLGHKQDDESGLIYMRARYYEPESGRFLSQDAARDGSNWYIYASNNPIGNVDQSGQALDQPCYSLHQIGKILSFGIGYLDVEVIPTRGRQWLCLKEGLADLEVTIQASATSSVAATGDFMLAQFALRLGVAVGMGLAGMVQGASKLRATGLDKVSSAAVGLQSILTLQLEEING